MPQIDVYGNGTDPVANPIHASPQITISAARLLHMIGCNRKYMDHMRWVGAHAAMVECHGETCRTISASAAIDPDRMALGWDIVVKGNQHAN